MDLTKDQIKPFARRAFLTKREDGKSCAMYNIRVDEKISEWRFRIHDCHTGIKLHGSLEIEDDYEYALERLNELKFGIVQFTGYLEAERQRRFKSNTDGKRLSLMLGNMLISDCVTVGTISNDIQIVTIQVYRIGVNSAFYDYKIQMQEGFHTLASKQVVTVEGVITFIKKYIEARNKHNDKINLTYELT